MKALGTAELARIEALLAGGGRKLLGLVGRTGLGQVDPGPGAAGGLAGAGAGVPMDGFHLADVELQRLGRAGRKGAPTPSTAPATWRCCGACGRSRPMKPSMRRSSGARSRKQWPGRSPCGPTPGCRRGQLPGACPTARGRHGAAARRGLVRRSQRRPAHRAPAGRRAIRPQSRRGVGLVAQTDEPNARRQPRGHRRGVVAWGN